MRIQILVCSIALLTAISVKADLLDRVAVTIDTQVITQSELEDEIRMNSFLNNEPANFSEQSKRDAANRLIEQKLVYREMELGRYPSASQQEADDVLDKLEKTRSHNKAEFDQALKTAGITRKQLEEHLLWGLTLSHFIDLRFRPAVQVSREDIEKYYESKILPDAKNGQRPSLRDVRQQISQTLTAERSDQQMDAWLKEAKTRVHIEFHNEAFREGAAK